MNELIDLSEYHHLSFFTNMRWVCQALLNSKQERCDYKTSLHISEKGEVVATDGRRLHIWESEWVTPREIPSGIYKVVTNKSKQLILERQDDYIYYPDWRVVWPDQGNLKRTNIHTEINYVPCLVGKETFQVFNYNYLLDAVGVGFFDSKDKMVNLDILSGEGGRDPLIVLPCDGCKALIMPVLV